MEPQTRPPSKTIGLVALMVMALIPTESRTVTAELATESHVHAVIPLCLALNRNQIELICRAYGTSDGRWLINQQFIDPLPQRPPYPCATHGFDEPNGDRAPLLRDDSVVPDRLDPAH